MFSYKNLPDLLKSNESANFVKAAETALLISRIVKDNNGRAIFVGGIVRDLLIKKDRPEKKLKDIDIEVFGLTAHELEKILNKISRPQKVGASFAVYKIGSIDISLPRKDSKTGSGHKGFTIEADSELTFKEAARRRSFTINAIGLDPLTGEIMDPYGGVEDLKNRILRIVNPETFVEDSLRVLRGMQFVGRFELTIDPLTLELCRSIDLSDLSPERIGDEWMKLLLLAERPSLGLEAAMEMGILEKLHQEIYILKGTPQEEEWHPEGDVWNHTLLTVDTMVKLIERDKIAQSDAEILILAALLHDIGKPDTTEKVDNKYRSFRHNTIGIEKAKKFMKDIKRSSKTIHAVLPLISEHHFLTFSPDLTDRAVRRLSTRLKPTTIKMLALLIEADIRSSLYREHRLKNVTELLEKAAELEVMESMPAPLITGKILLDKGYLPGPEMGKLLEETYQAQLDGLFFTVIDGLEWIKKNIS